MTVTIAPLRAQKPEVGEFLPYYGRYIGLVPDGDVVAMLISHGEETYELLRNLPASMSRHRYAPEKWTVNEMIGHLIDAERIFCYRALRFARNDPSALPGFEQNDYVRNASFDAVSLEDLAAEFKSVREATVFFFKHLDEPAWARRGVASGGEVSVRALAYIIAGHELHHRNILRNQYLASK